jgi:hypothetical protein
VRGHSEDLEEVKRMRAAFVTTWTAAVPGREMQALAYGRDVDDFFRKKASEGLCTEPKWLWAPKGESFWFVEGEYETLLGILATPEVQKFLVKGPIMAQDFGYGLYQVGRDEMFGLYEATLAEVGIG